MKVARWLAIAGIIMPLLGCTGQGGPGSAEKVKLETEDEKTLYALGLAVASNTLGVFHGQFTATEIEVIKKGFDDGLTGSAPQVEMDTYGTKLSEFLQRRMSQAAEKEKARGRAYVEHAATESGARQTASGLIYKELQAGAGRHPQEADRVKVHYHGTLIDGTVFDSSIQRGEPIVHPLNGFVPGWQEGLQLMKIGGKARLVVPPELAYGEQPVGQIPAGSTLIFEIELLDIE